MDMDDESMDLSKVDFEALRNVDIREVDPDTLVDIREVKIDQSFIRQVKNPYCFKVGKIAVSVGFATNGVTFEQQMGHYLQTL